MAFFDDHLNRNWVMLNSTELSLEFQDHQFPCYIAWLWSWRHSPATKTLIHPSVSFRFTIPNIVQADLLCSTFCKYDFLHQNLNCRFHPLSITSLLDHFIGTKETILLSSKPSVVSPLPISVIFDFQTLRYPVSNDFNSTVDGIAFSWYPKFWNSLLESFSLFPIMTLPTSIFI